MTEWKAGTVLVTGGAGFLGSYLVDEWVEAGAEVTAVDNLSSGAWKRLAHQGKRITRVEMDVCSPDFAGLLSGVDTVLNAAGLATGLCDFAQSHEQLFAGNVQIARSVREAAIAAGVSRYLEISSSCVYPDDAPVPTPELDLEGSELNSH